MTSTEPRNIKDGPFCWQSKTALRRIREAFDESTYLDQALAVYLAHTELASDEQAPTYTRPIRRVSEMSGVCMTRVKVIHKRLHALKLLDWKQNHIDGTSELANSTYTLLTLDTPCPTSGTPRTRLGKNAKCQNCLVVEESQNNKKESLKKVKQFKSESIDPTTI